MFCADYIASFFFHSSLNVGLHEAGVAYPERSPAPALLGGLSGLLAAIAVYPFDFVREGALFDQKMRFRHSLSTVPYAAVFFGLYFPCRDPESLRSQCFWAVASAAGAACAEAPFDRAKLAMMGGSRRTMVFANLMYVPFGALMLVMYDKAIIKYKAK